ncbi:MAG: type III-A CRISPR-associated RAMP protein Csm3 [Spirochaetota bacterium]
MDNLTISKIQGIIHLKTGLHIGGGTESIEIGGIDNPVIKDPLTGYPYIPGSSLKGKMRSLLELKYGKYGSQGEPCKCGGDDCFICKIFGNTNKDSKVGITRAIFRDAFLTEDSKEMLKKRNILATEAKVENSINRLKGKAENPRISERAIAGLEFNFEIAIRIFKDDKEEEIFKKMKEAFELLEQDALGGSGSRGYGKIEFKNVKRDGQPF